MRLATPHELFLFVSFFAPPDDVSGRSTVPPCLCIFLLVFSALVLYRSASLSRTLGGGTPRLAFVPPDFLPFTCSSPFFFRVTFFGVWSGVPILLLLSSPLAFVRFGRFLLRPLRAVFPTSFVILCPCVSLLSSLFQAFWPSAASLVIFWSCSFFPAAACAAGQSFFVDHFPRSVPIGCSSSLDFIFSFVRRGKNPWLNPMLGRFA